MTQTTQQPNSIPSTAYGLHGWQLDAWEKQNHPSFIKVTVHRGPCGVYAGWIMPEDSGSIIQMNDAMLASAYICGWLNGRDSKP